MMRAVRFACLCAVARSKVTPTGTPVTAHTYGHPLAQRSRTCGSIEVYVHQRTDDAVGACSNLFYIPREAGNVQEL
jgi:hypothetical protein